MTGRVADSKVTVGINEVSENLKLQYALSKHDELGEKQDEEQILFRSKRLIHPNSNFMSFWDINTILWLTFTAIVTPFEVAFINTDLGNPLFWINRVVDLFFILDMCLQVFIPYRDANTNEWVTDHRKIGVNYLKTWFLIDLLAILPFDIIGVATGSDDVQKIKALRLVRLLRLLKLLRLFRTSRIISRWAAIVPIRYAVTSLIRFSVAMVLTAHWIACLMGIIPSLEGTTWDDLTPSQIAAGDTPLNWQIAYFETNLRYPPGSYGIWTVYLGGFYLASMTVTTIGYGDVVAKTDVERGVMLIIMFIGGGFYAFAIGNIFSIISGMDPLTAEFHDTMDELNGFMFDVGLPRPLRKRVRKYFHFSLYHRRAINNAELLSYLTPSLKLVTAYVVNKAWVDQLPFLNNGIISEAERGLIVELGDLFKHRACGPRERIVAAGTPIDCVFVVERGAVLLHTTREIEDNGSVEEKKLSSHLYVQETVEKTVQDELITGTCFGHESIYGMQNDIRASYNVTTLTYTELHYIEKGDFLMTVRKYPEVYQRLKSYAVRREFVRTKIVPDVAAPVLARSYDVGVLENEIAKLRVQAENVRRTVEEKSSTVRRLIE